ncbi:MAG: hypothetical protein AB8G77_08065 [Rhodothermales bacterium]
MIGDKQLARLVKFFTEAPSSRYTSEDISITFGEARIKYDPVHEDYDATGSIDRAVYGKLMLDAATLAAGTLIEDRFVVNESFNLYAMKPMTEGKLIAVARLIHAQENRYTVEVRLLDVQGRSVASGHGSFSLSRKAFENEDTTNLDQSVSDEDDSEIVAYGNIWQTPFGYVHQN